MPRYEIVAHVIWEHDCETAEEAGAIVRGHLLAEPAGAAELVHLAAWRQDPLPAASPLPPRLRQKLADFFTSLERCADEAEEAFRGRVEALLTPEKADDQEPEEGSPVRDENTRTTLSHV